MRTIIPELNEYIQPRQKTSYPIQENSYWKYLPREEGNSLASDWLNDAEEYLLVIYAFHCKSPFKNKSTATAIHTMHVHLAWARHHSYTLQNNIDICPNPQRKRPHCTTIRNRLHLFLDKPISRHEPRQRIEEGVSLDRCILLYLHNDEIHETHP